MPLHLGSFKLTNQKSISYPRRALLVFADLPALPRFDDLALLTALLRDEEGRDALVLFVLVLLVEDAFEVLLVEVLAVALRLLLVEGLRLAVLLEDREMFFAAVEFLFELVLAVLLLFERVLPLLLALALVRLVLERVTVLSVLFFVVALAVVPRAVLLDVVGLAKPRAFERSLICLAAVVLFVPLCVLPLAVPLAVVPLVVVPLARLRSLRRPLVF